MTYHNDNAQFAAEWLRGLIDAGAIPAGTVDTRSITEVQGSDLKGYRQCHFFAGIGGWPLALQLAGWPDDVSVWTGSCPCQPFSQAGKGLGERDERHLWPEFLRLIAKCRPPVIFGEQVASSEVVGTQLEAAFATAVQCGDYARANKLAKRLVATSGFHYWARWIDRVQADLEAEGYALRFKVLGAHSVGANHIRQRLFWVADSPALRRTGCNGTGEQEQGVGPRCATDRLGLPNGTGPQPRNATTEADRHGSAAVATGPWSGSQPIQCRDGKARRVPSAQSGIQPLAHGIPRSMGDLVARLGELGVDTNTAKRIVRLARSDRVGCLRGYGNAIVPQVAAEFVRAFLETLGCSRSASGRTPAKAFR